MICEKNRLVLRKFTKLHKDEVEEEVIELKTFDDFLTAIKSSWNCEFFLYLGMYELGEIVGYKDDSISFIGMLGFGDYDTPFDILKNNLSKAIDKEITIEDFFEFTLGRDDVKLVDNAENAWELIHNSWSPIFILKHAINPQFTEDKNAMKNENRIIFVKNL
ncbi:MAG: hypothetical protein J6C46_05850 [Clostridia bacterium]|nr:hypothetical protein [Clostridia bacterium]